MTKTKNYQLPQWEADDPMWAGDFNSAMANVDAALAENKETARAAQERADETRAARPYVVGSYTGDGATTHDISVGFHPRFLVICTNQRTSSYAYMGTAIAMAGPNINYQRLYLTASGFRVDSSDTSNKYPELNIKGTVYDYIAFK